MHIAFERSLDAGPGKVATRGATTAARKLETYIELKEGVTRALGPIRHSNSMVRREDKKVLRSSIWVNKR